MANYFRGESNLNAQASIDLNKLPPLKRWAALLCFVVWIPFAFLLFVPDMLKVGVAGLIASFFIYIPLVILYVAGFKGKTRTVPYILLAVGVLGEAGYLLVSSYLENNELTSSLMAVIFCVPLFLVFFIVGVCLLSVGIKRNKRWKAYSNSVMATVVGYKNITTGMFVFDNIAPGLNNPIDRTTVYSPVIQYEFGGQVYRGETDSYFGGSQVPPVGHQIEIHVSPENPGAFMLKLQSGGMLTAGGISFIAVSVLAVIITAVILSVMGNL